MYYVVKSIQDAKRIYKLHPNILLEAIEFKVRCALDTIRERYEVITAFGLEGQTIQNDEPAVYITGICVECGYLSYFKRNEAIYGKQGYLTTKIKY